MYFEAISASGTYQPLHTWSDVSRTGNFILEI